MPAEHLTYKSRRERATEALRARGFAALLLSPGSDLAYLAGYRISASERLTCLVIGADGAATLLVPELESPRAKVAAPDLTQRIWSETEDPYAAVAALVTAKGDIAVADQMWSSFVLRLQAALHGRGFQLASFVTRGLRMRKDASEREALRAVSAAADRAFPRLIQREFAGRTEREVGAELATLLREEGHDDVSFTIVASGPNGASPHHETGERRIARGDTVVLDFGGTREWYCSDITRTVHVGADIEDEVRRVHDVVRRSQEAGYSAARAGATAASVDAAARRVIDDAGYGERFIHRTGHGIGLDGHEHPYLVRGNLEPLEPGMAFSIEPGVYIPGRFGVRIEDIAILGDDGRAEPLNRADHGLAIVR
ncbi:MAG TPA: Xaa-Pro peptidase family protein [Candidatus Limnocylindria bacterium]|nr:Xaa-Pro peptidase family protein [Candidatus Limnocylindria bacterium]